MRIEEPDLGIYEYQTPATLNQAAPVQNTWYTILDTTTHCRIYEIAVNIEDANETLEIQVTIDGQTIGATAKAATHSTTYYVYRESDAINRVNTLILDNALTKSIRAFQLEGHSVKVEVRKTTAAGAGNLTGIVTYGVLKPIG